MLILLSDFLLIGLSSWAVIIVQANWGSPLLQKEGSWEKFVSCKFDVYDQVIASLRGVDYCIGDPHRTIPPYLHALG